MITIEVKQTDVKRNKVLVVELVRLLRKGAYFHFFYEPVLIIRLKATDFSSQKKIKRELKRRRLKFIEYPYPFTKKGRFGEDRRGIIVQYRHYFEMLFYLNSQLSITRNPKNDLAIIERANHTFLNTMGYSWSQEVQINSVLAEYRLRTIRHYDSPTLGTTLLAGFVIFLLKTARVLTKLL